MATKYSILLYLCFCHAFLLGVKAQDVPRFIEKLTTDEGLSNNNINDLEEDDNGFLWIATTDGLNRFDGTAVVQYFHEHNGNSLPHNYVYCLKKLPGNRLAIGTQGGIGFYNGNTSVFNNFYYKQNSALDELDNSIIELETDANGNLWAASRNCVFIFDPNLKLKKILSSPFTEAQSIKQRLRFVEKILPLVGGDVLLYLYDGWYVYSNKTNGVLSLKKSAYAEQLQFLKVISAPRDVKKIDPYFPFAHVFKAFEKYFLCIAPYADTLFLLDEKGHQLSSCFFPYNKYPHVLWSQQISTIDSTRLLMMFHDRGLVDIQISWQQNRPVLKNVSSLLFSEHEYTSALRDHRGNWWLATAEAGLKKISPNKQYFTSATLVDPNSGKQINYEVVSSSNYKNTLWVATYGDGFFEIDLSTGKQQQHHFYKTGNDPWPNFIWNIRTVSADTLWVGTQEGMFWYSVSSKNYGRLPTSMGKPPVLDTVAITTQFTDSHGLVWMGLGKGKGVCYFDTKSKRFTYYPGTTPNGGYPLRYPLNIAEDEQGDLWFTNDASALLVKWKRNANRFQTVSLPASIQKQIGGLYGIWCEGNSTLWLGSLAYGLIKFQPASNSVTVYSHEKGLNSSHISSIFEDHKKRLWLITESGLSCFNQHAETFVNYTSRDGLPVQYPTDYFYYNAANGRLFAGGYGKVFYFDPDLVAPDEPAQKTFITSMLVNGKVRMPGNDQPAKFSDQENDITIQYTAVDLTNGAETKYEYKLIGEDTSWIFAGNQRQMNFSHLAPGGYTFMVRAANSSGVWSRQVASVNFRIASPFTQTIWFYALMLLAIAAVFYTIHRFRLSQLLRIEQIRSEISRNLHDEVGANLTNISLSSLLAQKQLNKESPVSLLLDRIYQDSQTVSQAMREIVWSINPKIDTLGEALPRMMHYASELLEANNIALTAEIAPEVERVKLTMKQRRDVYLIFKEAVNNMAKHSKAAHAKITISMNKNVLIMMIADDGTGFDISAPLIHNGLKNMRERSENYHWQLLVTSQNGLGTTIVLNAGIA
jgi:signal transduction histidine kinase/ligand-binding sensor domain-containing protein